MYTVYGRMYGDFPVKNTVYTPNICIYVWFCPTLAMRYAHSFILTFNTHTHTHTLTHTLTHTHTHADGFAPALQNGAGGGTGAYDQKSGNWKHGRH